MFGPNQPAPRRATYGIVTASLALALVVVGVAFSAGHRAQSSALPSVINAVKEARQGKPIPGGLIPAFDTIKRFPPRYRIPWGCLPHNPDKVGPAAMCRVGVAKSQKVIALLGDSHAFMWSPAIIVMAQRDGWAVVPLIRFGCTPEKWFTHRGPGGPICRAWLHWAMGQIQTLRPAVTLVGGSVGETATSQASAAAAGMIKVARKLKPLSPVVVIGDPEGLSENPVQCLTAPGASRAGCMTTWPASSLAAYDRIARGTESSGAAFLPTRGFVCYQRQCPPIVGHTIVWMDTNHLTGIYSAQVASPFRKAFLRVLPSAGDRRHVSR
jgi:SGNH domain-containing protein